MLRLHQLLLLQQNICKLPVQSEAADGVSHGGGVEQANADWKLPGNVMRSCKTIKDMVQNGHADGLGMPKLKAALDKSCDMVETRAFKLISDAEHKLQSAIATAKPWAGGLGDGTSWTAKLETHASWEQVAVHAAATLAKTHV